MSVYVEAGGGVGFGDRLGQHVQRPGVGDSLVRAVEVAELPGPAQGVEQVPLVPDQGAVGQFAAAGLRAGPDRSQGNPAGDGRLSVDGGHDGVGAETEQDDGGDPADPRHRDHIQALSPRPTAAAATAHRPRVAPAKTASGA